MKKLLKSKIAVSVLAVALVATLILGGTYAWFVVQEGGNGMTAQLEAAYIKINYGQNMPDVYEIKPVFTTDDFGFDVGNDNGRSVINGQSKVLITSSDCDLGWTGTSANPGVIIYPGEGIQANFGSNISVDHNRAVVLQVAFASQQSGNIVDQLEEIAGANGIGILAGNSLTPATTPFYRYPVNPISKLAPDTNLVGSYLAIAATDNEADDVYSAATLLDEVYFDLNLTDITDMWIDATNAVAYIYLPAPSGTATTTNITGDVSVGLKGLKLNQNYWMKRFITVDLFPTLTAVQATRTAVEDVFDPLKANTGLSDWLDTLPIHD